MTTEAILQGRGNKTRETPAPPSGGEKSARPKEPAKVSSPGQTPSSPEDNKPPKKLAGAVRVISGEHRCQGCLFAHCRKVAESWTTIVAPPEVGSASPGKCQSGFGPMAGPSPPARISGRADAAGFFRPQRCGNKRKFHLCRGSHAQCTRHRVMSVLPQCIDQD